MLKDRFDTIYFNGCSFTEGGGFEKGKYWVSDAYKEQYNFRYNNEKDVCYPTIVQKLLPEIKVINEAKSGSGSEKIIRNVYEYIYKNGIEKSKKTLFILEIQEAINRLEVFSNKYNQYLVANVSYDTKGKILDTQTTLDWIYGPQMSEDYRNKTRELIREYSEYFIHPHYYEKNIAFQFLGLFSFLRANNIEFIVSYARYFDNNFISFERLFPNFMKENILEIEIDGKKYDSILTLAGETFTRICDEIGTENSEDGHPGFQAHKMFAEGIVNLINKKYL